MAKTTIPPNQSNYTTNPTGTGLGLSITQKIVSRHYGTDVSSVGTKGTTFIVTIPQYYRKIIRSLRN